MHARAKLAPTQGERWRFSQSTMIVGVGVGVPRRRGGEGMGVDIRSRIRVGLGLRTCHAMLEGATRVF